MKSRWHFIPPKIALIATLLFSFGGVFVSKPAFACTGTEAGIQICMTTSGAGVSVVQPHLSCSTANGIVPGNWNILLGCNGGNVERRGQANYYGVQEWVERTGWTFSGTGDNLRYFTFINYAYFTPVDTSHYITYSDGSDNNCYGGGNRCDYQAWDNYIGPYSSPTAQLRDWTDEPSRTDGDVNEPALSAPFAGTCQGTQSGQTSSTFNAGLALANSGSIGYSTTGTYTYYKDGECNANTPDGDSVYMNLNWSGAVWSWACVCYVNVSTTKAQDFVNVTGFVGPNNANHRHFVQGWNMTVNWWWTASQSIVDYNIEGSDTGPNAPYEVDTWSY